MGAITLSIEIPDKQYGEIEEYCVNKAISISDYFLSLHELSQQYEWRVKKDREQRFGESHSQFGKIEILQNEEESKNTMDEKIQEITKHRKNKLKQ